LVEKVENSMVLFQNSTEIPIVLNNHFGNYIAVKADGEQLLGVFNNLIKNAIQAIPDEVDGKITIEILSDDENITIAIKDNGKGIPEAIQKNLFVPSFTTKTGGMGLGLAIARRIVENAGGRIWFETQEGKGSSFFVEFPQLTDSL
jgi:signal transduction histidine kinase